MRTAFLFHKVALSRIPFLACLPLLFNRITVETQSWTDFSLSLGSASYQLCEHVFITKHINQRPWDTFPLLQSKDLITY